MSPSYQISLRAYPHDYRREHGPELVATANEMSPAGWSFRQARSLVVEGLRTRARRAAGPEGHQVWFDGMAFGVAIWYILFASSSLTVLIGVGGHSTDPSPPPELTAAVGMAGLAALTVTSRWPTALIHTVLAGLLFAAFYESGPPQEIVVAGLVAHLTLIAFAWWLALRGPGRRALSPTAAFLLLAAATAIAWALGSAEATVPAVAAIIGLPLIGFASIAIDPRPLIAAATVWLRLVVSFASLTLAIPDPTAIIQTTTAAVVFGIIALASRYSANRFINT